MYFRIPFGYGCSTKFGDVNFNIIFMSPPCSTFSQGHFCEPRWTSSFAQLGLARGLSLAFWCSEGESRNRHCSRTTRSVDGRSGFGGEHPLAHRASRVSWSHGCWDPCFHLDLGRSRASFSLDPGGVRCLPPVCLRGSASQAHAGCWHMVWSTHPWRRWLAAPGSLSTLPRPSGPELRP